MASGQVREHATAQLGVGEPLEHRIELHRRLLHVSVPQKARRLQWLDPAQEARECPGARRRDLGTGTKAGDDPLERDAVERGVVQDERAEDRDSDRHEILDRVSGRVEGRDVVSQEVEAPSGRTLLLVPGPAPEIFVILEEALAAHFTPDVAAFVQVVFSLHEPDELRGLMADAGFRRFDARAHSRTLRLPSPEEFLWQYVSSTPLAAAVTDLDDHARTAVAQDVVASWQPFTQQGRLMLELGFSVASGER